MGSGFRLYGLLRATYGWGNSLSPRALGKLGRTGRTGLLRTMDFVAIRFSHSSPHNITEGAEVGVDALKSVVRV